MQRTSSKDTDIKLTAVTGPGVGRRRFFSNAALAIAAARLDLFGFEAAPPPDNRRVGETKIPRTGAVLHDAFSATEESVTLRKQTKIGPCEQVRVN
jgi:hypothetical protein